MENVIEIISKKVFSLDRAQHLLPLIVKITEEAEKEKRALLVRLEIAQLQQNMILQRQIEREMDQAVDRWFMKVEKLGGTPKGLWFVDFDNGAGYYCWRYPEPRIMYYHGYDDGFAARLLIR